jgi:hypothetical protein
MKILKPYIERVKKGQANILWTDTLNILPKLQEPLPDQNIFLFLKKECLFRLQELKVLFSLYQQKNNADFVNGKMIFLQGSPELEEVFGIKTGRLSGIVAHHIPNYLQKNRLPSWETNIMEDWEAKVDKIVEETERENMTLISGIPPWLIMYFEKLTEKHGKKSNNFS